MQRAAEVEGLRSIAGFALGLLAIMVALNVNLEPGHAGGMPIPIGPPAQALGPRDQTLRAIPLVISVPHGGSQRPEAIPDRQGDVLVNDPLSLEFGRELAAEIERISGSRPYIVVNNLHRIKMDPNRPLAAGAQGNAQAIAEWESFHLAIENAAAAALERCGRGLYLEVHTHGVPGRWTELGYGLTTDDLDRPDEELQGLNYAARASVRSLAMSSLGSLPEIVRGESSLGGLIEAAGYRVTPSPRYPVPKIGYFEGGYGVYRHGSSHGGGLDAVQLEAPYDLMDPARRPDFVRALASALVEFMQSHYGLELNGEQPATCYPYADVSADHPAAEAIRTVESMQGLDPCAESPREFCPDNSVSRLEAGRLLWLTLHPGQSVPIGSSEVFADVENPGSQVLDELWLKGYLTSCEESGLSFCPEADSTRRDLAIMALKAVHGPDYVPPKPTPGAALTNWEEWWMAAAGQQGFLEGCGAMAVQECAREASTRAEWALAMDQVLANTNSP